MNRQGSFHHFILYLAGFLQILESQESHDTCNNFSVAKSRPKNPSKIMRSHQNPCNINCRSFCLKFSWQMARQSIFLCRVSDWINFLLYVLYCVHVLSKCTYMYMLVGYFPTKRWQNYMYVIVYMAVQASKVWILSHVVMRKSMCTNSDNLVFCFFNFSCQ